jgi:hypothetical protein
MLQRLTPKQRFELLIEQFEPKVRQAFRDAIDDITDAIVIRHVVERLEVGDLSGAVDVMRIEIEAFRPLEEAIQQAFGAGGSSAVEGMPAIIGPDGYRAIVRFGVRNVAAENWLREHSSTLITNIVEDQRIAVRETLEASLQRGDNPTRTATTVVGKVNRATGRREGGILGLSAPQARYVSNARLQLSSGDPEAMQEYLTRVRRDKRFDRTVLKAIREGKTLPRDVVDKIVGRYSAKLLELRADTIALNETFNAMAASRDQAFRQQIEKGLLNPDHVTKTWKHTPQEAGRLQHIAMHNQKVRYNEPFIAPDSTPIMYPHAPGVPAHHVIGCKCFCEYKIDFAAQLVNR